MEELLTAHRHLKCDTTHWEAVAQEVQLIAGLVVRSPPPPVLMLKCPWARH